MPTYVSASKADNALLAEIIAENHPEFKEHGVTFALFYAHATRDPRTGEPKGFAIRADREHGADYKVKINSYADRVEGKTDATIYLDGDTLDTWPDPKKRARLDIAVRELEIVSDEEGKCVLDDCGRPKLRRACPDIHVRGWYDTAQRHRDHALEVEALRSLKKDFVQGVFSFG